MTRVDFTRLISALLIEMSRQGENPIADFLKRSDEEQKRLYDQGLSKCDGINNVSMHQRGKALDIYFVEDGVLGPPKKGYDFWHEIWVNWGGEPAISWDEGHFEAK